MLRFEFSNGNIPGLHLMLNGRIYLFEKTNEYKNSIIELLVNDHAGLVLTDYLARAAAALNPEEKTSPDALSGKAGFTSFKRKAF